MKKTLSLKHRISKTNPQPLSRGEFIRKTNRIWNSLRRFFFLAKLSSIIVCCSFSKTSIGIGFSQKCTILSTKVSLPLQLFYIPMKKNFDSKPQHFKNTPQPLFRGEYIGKTNLILHSLLRLFFLAKLSSIIVCCSFFLKVQLE